MRGLDLGYFVRRVGMFFLVVFVAATFNFFIPRLAPGNPIGAMTSRMANASSGLENGQETEQLRRIVAILKQLGVRMTLQNEDW